MAETTRIPADCDNGEMYIHLDITVNRQVGGCCSFNMKGDPGALSLSVASVMKKYPEFEAVIITAVAYWEHKKQNPT